MRKAWMGVWVLGWVALAAGAETPAAGHAPATVTVAAAGREAKFAFTPADGMTNVGLLFSRLDADGPFANNTLVSVFGYPQAITKKDVAAALGQFLGQAKTEKDIDWDLNQDNRLLGELTHESILGDKKIQQRIWVWKKGRTLVFVLYSCLKDPEEVTFRVE